MTLAYWIALSLNTIKRRAATNVPHEYFSTCSIICLLSILCCLLRNTHEACKCNTTVKYQLQYNYYRSSLVLEDKVFYRAMLRRARLCHSMLSVRPSVRPSVCDVQVRWSHKLDNTSKIISRLTSLKFMIGLIQHRRSGPTGTPQN